MRRGDIRTGVVYGFSEDRAHIYRYHPVLVVSLNSYVRPRYGDRQLQYAGEPRERLNRGGWRSHTAPVGLLAVSVSDDGLAHLDELIARATPEAALRALNSDDLDDRRILFGTDVQSGHPVVLGQYMLVTSSGDLHGDYAELTEARARHDQYVEQVTREQEEARLAMLAEYRKLNTRLVKLGITGYDVADYESPSRFEGLRFEDMERLLDLADIGIHHNID